MDSAQGRPQGYAVEMIHIDKSFGALHALDDVTLRVKYGEVHAVLGENGAGKSTLMSILFGLKHQDKGVIKVDGKEVKIRNPNDATSLGIGMVHQHFKLVDVFSVLDNIVLGKESEVGGFLTQKKAYDSVKSVLDRYGIDLDLKAKVSDIPVAAQQKTEIAKVLYRNANIIILDEPTAVLTPQEIDNLMTIIKNFAKEGKAVILITHKLNEIKQVADKVTVLRRGRYMGTFDVKDCSTDDLAELMVGKKVNFTIDKADLPLGEPVLEVKHFSCDKKDRSKKAVDDVSFTVHANEVVAIAAIEGNGQEELLSAITGLEKFPKTSGEVILHGSTPKSKDGVNVLNQTTKDRIEEGMSDIPSDRLKYGLILDYDIQQNLVSRTLKAPFTVAGFLKKGQIAKHGSEVEKTFDIRSSAGIKTRTGDMSGGNQQKVIIARELVRKPKLLVSDQATRGLDVGAIEFVNRQIIKARDEGCAVLLYSTELEDIFNLATVIYVMHAGKIVAKLDPKKTDFREVGLYMGGGNEKSEGAKAEETLSSDAVIAQAKAEKAPAEAILDRFLAQGLDFAQAKKATVRAGKALIRGEVAAMLRYGVYDFERAKTIGCTIVKGARQLVKPAESPVQAVVNPAFEASAEASPDEAMDIHEAIRQDEARVATMSLKGNQALEGSDSAAKTKKLPFLFRSTGLVAFLDSIVAILIGLFLGFLVMLAVKPGSAAQGFSVLFTSSFRRGAQTAGTTIWYAGPLILLGLAVAIPNKGGLFNIGASGQFTVGAIGAFLTANYLAPYIDNKSLFLLVFLAGLIFGAIYGMIPGLLKAFLNVNEVVSTIMLNWTAVYLAVMVIMMPDIYNPGKTAANYQIPNANVPVWGMQDLFPKSSHLDSGIIVALIAAVLIFVLISHTAFGFKLRASGISKDASKYAGYNAKSIIVTSMALGGAMAGLAAVYYFLPSTPQGYLQPVTTVATQGFDGISVALIANNNPLGVIFSGLFLSMLRQANIPLQQAGYEKNIVDIIMGVVIYSTAAAKIVSAIVRKLSVAYALRKEREAKQADDPNLAMSRGKAK